MIERAVGHLKKLGLVRINRSERTVEFLQTGGSVTIYSMDNPDSIRGECFHLVIIDEAAMIAEDAWTQCIQPTLADYDGDCIIISTPKGRNWFWKEYQRGISESARAKQEGRPPRQAAFHAPTSANPNPNIRRAFELAKEKVSERTYRQEWMAEFLEDGGTVFRNVTKCAIAKIKKVYDSVFVMGVDWGKESDYTVCIVRDAVTGETVDWDRFNTIGWSFQRGRLVNMWRKWKPAVVLVEENSIGGPNLEMLQAEGLPVLGFNTNAATKAPLVESYALSMEREEITIPDDDDHRVEHEAYEGEKNPKTGRMKYGAPEEEDAHDDTVIAGALSDWARVHIYEYLALLEQEGSEAVADRVTVRSS
jgi:hypothetical protein